MRSRKRVICAIAFSVAAALVVVSVSTSDVQPPHAYFIGDFPPSMAVELQEVVGNAAAEYDLHPVAWNTSSPDRHSGHTFSLELLKHGRKTSHLPMRVSGSGPRLSLMFFDNRFYQRAALTAAQLDTLIVDIVEGLEDELQLKLCRKDIDRGLCTRPARPHLQYVMDVDGALPEKDGWATHEITVRHGVRSVVTRDWQLEEIFDANNLFEVRMYADRRSLFRGEFPLLFTNAPLGDRLTLSVFDRGEMPADDLDALLRDVKSTLERRYGRRFCRAHPDTGVCDAEHREMESQREAWLEARAVGTSSAVEEFLALHPKSPHAGVARRHLVRLGAMAVPPAAAPARPATPWVGRRAGSTFADTLDDGSRGPAMTVVAGGLFHSGCVSGVGCRLDESPTHPVRIARPFALSTREVTHTEYFRFAKPNKRIEPWWADRPVTHVTWAEAAAYAAWLSERTGAAYRLPSEAEWEWAARAGTATAYPWGNRASDQYALCAGCGLSWPPSPWVAPTGSLPPNPWGFFDMHGNAAEWTADCWHSDHLGASSDGSARTDGDCSLRVVRGGSYDTPPHALRSAARVGKVADERYPDVGVRVLRELRNIKVAE